MTQPQSAVDPDVYVREQEDPDFVELRRRYRGFAFPMTAAFLLWYFTFVLLATYAPEWMAQPVWGNITIGLVLGVGQFASTALITWLYVRHANSQLDTLAGEIRERIEEGGPR